MLCFGRCNSQLGRSRAGFHCNAMFILCCLAVGRKSKSTLFLWQKDAAGLVVWSLENRNHGLTWSQSGNNKTVQTLLSLFKSCYQGREYALQSEDSHLWEKTSSWSLLSHNAFLHSWSSFSISYNFVSVNHYPWQFNILQRKLMSWAQRHTILQKNKTKQNNIFIYVQGLTIIA